MLPDTRLSFSATGYPIVFVNVVVLVGQFIAVKPVGVILLYFNVSDPAGLVNVNIPHVLIPVCVRLVCPVDFFANLKQSPSSNFGKVYYERPEPSGDSEFIPYGGPVHFPMNKQLYQLMDSSNQDRSFSQINGKNYTGKSGQNLFDLQYTKTNSFGVTGDYYRVMLINRENGENITNNVGEFITDYYSTIKLVDTVDIGAQIVNLISGAMSYNAEIGFGNLENQSRFFLLVSRILGLCFDDRREIDVSGVAKVAELDGVDDSFFELNEIDLRNIDSEISNVQNGIMEFIDCDNIKLPVDSETLVSQLIQFRCWQMLLNLLGDCLLLTRRMQSSRKKSLRLL